MKYQVTKYNLAQARSLFSNDHCGVAPLSGILPPLFADEADYRNWLSEKQKKYGHEEINGSINSIVNQKLFLGVDCGDGY